MTIAWMTPWCNFSLKQGYEMRQYPSVKWACSEVTFEAEEGSLEPAAGESNEFDIIKMMQQMMSRKNWKNKPENQMFMKLFR